jgi:hypothetical protein
MNTLTIHHDLIGAYPELADFDLSAEIQSFKSVKELSFVTAYKIAGAAEHFYGLSYSDYGSLSALIDAVRSVEQSLMVH